jgi:chemotaxis protein CheD
MMAKRYLNPGDMYFGGDVLVETLLGSCVAITLWYAAARKGGVCHFMLPDRQSPRRLAVYARDLDGRYGREAWLWLQQQSRAHGLRLEQAEIGLYGGSRALELGHVRGAAHIGRRNIECAEACLREVALVPRVRDLGGDGHRVLRVDLVTGRVSVRHGQPLSHAVEQET